MKKLQTYLSGIAAVLLLAALGACTDDDKTLNDVYLETDASYYSANARGLTSNGEEVVIRIKSNTYWMVTYDKGTGLEEPWFTLAREGGNGSADLAVTVQRNDGKGRKDAQHVEIRDALRSGRVFAHACPAFSASSAPSGAASAFGASSGTLGAAESCVCSAMAAARPSSRACATACSRSFSALVRSFSTMCFACLFCSLKTRRSTRTSTTAKRPNQLQNLS